MTDSPAPRRPVATSADARDVEQLARRLRGKGLSDAEVVEGLKGLGYSTHAAKTAVAGLNPTPAPAPAPGGGRAPGRTPETPAPTPPTPGSPGGNFPGFSAPTLPSLTLTPPRKLNAGDWGGFAAGMLGLVLLLNYLRYGPEGVTGWFSAKFLNKPALSLPDAAGPFGKGTGRMPWGKGGGTSSTPGPAQGHETEEPAVLTPGAAGPIGWTPTTPRRPVAPTN